MNWHIPLFLFSFSMNAHSQDIDRKLKSLQTEYETLEKELKSAHKKIETLEDNVHNLSKDKQTAKKNMAELKREIGELRNQNAGLKFKTTETEKLKEEATALKDEIKRKDSLTKERDKLIQTLENNIESLEQAHIAELRQLNADFDKIRRDLEEKLSKKQIKELFPLEYIPDEAKERTVVLFPELGIIITKNSSPTGSLSGGFTVGTHKNIFAGLSIGMDSYSYHGFTGYPAGISLKWCFSQDGFNFDTSKIMHTIFTIDGGVSLINEKYELIDNLRGPGLFYNVGVQQVFSILSTNLTIKATYKNLRLKELSTTVKEYFPITYSNLNINIGFIIHLNQTP